MYEIFGILFLAVVVPLMIIGHYMTKWREAKSLSNADERMMEELWENAGVDTSITSDTPVNYAPVSDLTGLMGVTWDQDPPGRSWTIGVQ